MSAGSRGLGGAAGHLDLAGDGLADQLSGAYLADADRRHALACG